MKDPNDPLTRLLKDNPEVVLAYYDDPASPSCIHVYLDRRNPILPAYIPTGTHGLELVYHNTDKPKIRITRNLTVQQGNLHQQCQDEPVHCGTQIQPAGGNWYGTAGAPVAFVNHHGQLAIGVLSNYHVMAMGDTTIGRAQHQPDAARPVFARLAAYVQPLPGIVNYIDAAFADAWINGYHTISREVLNIGPIPADPSRANIGLAVCKSGRTTGRTCGRCIATGASVTVAYDDYDALFADQDIFEGEGAPFSAPGDSGSLIVTGPNFHPVALLFAGNDQLTVGNPIQHVMDDLNVVFGF